MTMIRHFSGQDIVMMEQRSRAAFINSLSGFKSVSLVGTSNNEGLTNLAIFNSVIHIGANPALIGMIIRPNSVNRHTLENIMETNCYTINHINKDIYKKAHQTSARYPKEISEFDAVGLTQEFHNKIKSPYVKESHIKFGLQFVEHHDLKINGTILIIGKVIEVFVPENCLTLDGVIDVEKAGTITTSGLDSYHSTNRLSRLTYAKPNTLPLELVKTID
jgi:flavin reductase (DIM6/NTAB) family NADH-FMN oxidoreductase RutF